MLAAPTQTRYTWKLLNAGPLWLDGGSMFGIVPRAIWNRTVPCDDQGRIELAHNCLLLDGPQPIVIETGSGDKFDAKTRRIYGLGDRTIINALHDAGGQCDDVDHVIVTHLHFDHAGGLTRRGDGGGIVQTFPNATIHVQRREWDDALANRSVMTRTYLRENLEPIRSQVELCESPTPFPVGYLPQRDELPSTDVSHRETEILPGIFVFNVPGHTWGQQAVRFCDERGRDVVFCPDLIPTAAHVGAAYNMAYDVEPFISTVTRRWFLEEAVERNWLLVLDHEPGNPRRVVQRDGKGWYELMPVE